MAGPSTLSRYLNTIKYLRPVQLYGRIYSGLKKGIKQNAPGIIPIPQNLKMQLPLLLHELWNSDNDVNKGVFTFLNETRNTGTPINWDPDASLLWKFNLHYFYYLFRLTKENKEKLCLEWIKSNKDKRTTGWHPYVISLRLINWINADIKNEDITKSIYEQAAYLYRNTEFYHPANHYLANAKALIFSGLYFKTAESSGWLKKGKYIYSKELPHQVLSDGCYFEKSIMYHSIILKDILDIINIYPEEDTFKEMLKNYAYKMMHFIYYQSDQSGNINLFNDSTEEITPGYKVLKDYYEKLGLEPLTETPGAFSFKSSGFYGYKNGDIHITIDGGSIGPDDIPAHAHADIFTYILTSGGRPFIVDSGVFEYRAGKMRDYVRSTAAHNTVNIDDKDQAECWGSFRVARRYAPEDVKFKTNNEDFHFEGVFKGYGKLIGDNLIHKREIEYSIRAGLITIKDKVTGTKAHAVKSFIHLHPDVEMNIQEKGIVLTNKNTIVRLKHESDYIIEEGWYCPQFGKQLKNKIIIFTTTVPGTITYSLSL